MVTIQHPNGVFTRYAHMDGLNVSTGQDVKKGQQIGIQGNTNGGFDMENNKIENKKSSAFLSNYSWKGKDRKQIIEEMDFEDYEQKYLDQAMKELIQEEKYNGFELDKRVMLLFEMNEEDDGGFDENDAEYMG